MTGNAAFAILAAVALTGTAQAGAARPEAAQAGAAPARALDDQWATPTIHGYGRIHYRDAYAYRPDPKATYRIVFALTQGAKAPGEVNPSLDRVARTINLYVASGVPLDHLKLVAIAYGGATPIVLDDTQYRAGFGVANPNLALIAALRAAGVDVAVCAQAVAEHAYQDDWIDRHVTLALSGLTTITVFEQQGYALMPL